jgi:glycyl-tRNA synthetase (class II)
MYKNVYSKLRGSKGLVVYEKKEIILKNYLIKEWENIFIEELTEYIDGPQLIPLKYLEQSGHLAKHNKDSKEIYLVSNYLALRPETCSTIFAYYKSKYGSRCIKTDIAQVGKSFRNEKSTRNLDYRLNEFYQLEIECFEPISVKRVELKVNELILFVTPKFKTLYEKSKIYFEKLGILVSYNFIKVEDRPFYSNCTIDIYVTTDLGPIEIGCLNDRGTHDIGKDVNVVELSIGLHRLIVYKSKTNT